MLLYFCLAALAVWGSIATVLAVRRDGLRRIPSAPIARAAARHR